jgi:hypothetical protein
MSGGLLRRLPKTSVITEVAKPFPFNGEFTKNEKS